MAIFACCLDRVSSPQFHVRFSGKRIVPAGDFVHDILGALFVSSPCLGLWSRVVGFRENLARRGFGRFRAPRFQRPRALGGCRIFGFRAAVQSSGATGLGFRSGHREFPEIPRIGSPILNCSRAGFVEALNMRSV